MKAKLYSIDSNSETGIVRLEFITTPRNIEGLTFGDGLDDYEFKKIETKKPKATFEDFIGALNDFINVYVDSTDNEFEKVLEEERKQEERSRKGRKPKGKGIHYYG